MKDTPITEEKRGIWRRVRECEVIGSPRETGEEVGFDEGCTCTPREGNTAVVGEVREAVEGVEEGASNEVVDGGPLECSSNALELFRRERHGRGNEGVEESGGGSC